MAGCAGLDAPRSQLFGSESAHQSAAITYRSQRATPERAPAATPLAKLLAGAEPSTSPARQVTTLAIRYPHPAGRAGYARVECIVETDPPAGNNQTGLSAWLGRARRLADESLPGVSLGDGVQEAMGLDVPIADLDTVIARLQQFARQGTAAIGVPGKSATARVVATIDGATLPTATRRVAELDRLAARVRRDGAIISHTSRTSEADFEAAVGAAAHGAPPPNREIAALVPEDKLPAPPAPASGQVVQASYTQPTTSRLPPVEATAE